MSTAFAIALNEARDGIHLNQLAKAMAKPDAKDPRGPAGNLSRLQKGKQEPSEKKVEEIVEALASLRNLSPGEFNHWRGRLLNAAGYGTLEAAGKLREELKESEAAVRERLRPACQEALQTVPTLTEHAIQNILDHIEISTMKLIIAAAERGEEIEIVQLQKISGELQQTAQRYIGAVATADSDKADTVIKAGRARIMIDGDVTPAQMQVLENAAEMIESVLKL